MSSSTRRRYSFVRRATLFSDFTFRAARRDARHSPVHVTSRSNPSNARGPFNLIFPVGDSSPVPKFFNQVPSPINVVLNRGVHQRFLGESFIGKSNRRLLSFFHDRPLLRHRFHINVKAGFTAVSFHRTRRSPLSRFQARFFFLFYLSRMFRYASPFVRGHVGFPRHMCFLMGFLHRCCLLCSMKLLRVYWGSLCPCECG